MTTLGKSTQWAFPSLSSPCFTKSSWSKTLLEALPELVHSQRPVYCAMAMEGTVWKPVPHPISVAEIPGLGLCVVMTRTTWRAFAMDMVWNPRFLVAKSTPIRFRAAVDAWLSNSSFAVKVQEVSGH